jgi:hypothetical protein
LKLENYHCLMIICGFVLLNLCMNGEDDVLMSLFCDCDEQLRWFVRILRWLVVAVIVSYGG